MLSGSVSIPEAAFAGGIKMSQLSQVYEIELPFPCKLQSTAYVVTSMSYKRQI